MTTEAPHRTRLAVDIGGTFTDVVLEKQGILASSKVLTTPRRPAEGFMAGVAEVLEATGTKPAEVELIIHGTTLATNALIERRGARTALIVTEGHRDTLAIGYENRFAQYDINADRAPPWCRASTAGQSRNASTGRGMCASRSTRRRSNL